MKSLLFFSVIMLFASSASSRINTSLHTHCIASPEALLRAIMPPDDLPRETGTLTWEAPGSDFVLLPGLEEAPQGIKGEREVSSDGIILVIAVLKDRIEAKFVQCEPGPFPGPGPNEPVLPIFMIYSAKETYSQTFASATSNLEEVMRTLLGALQDEGFPTLWEQWADYRYSSVLFRYTGISPHPLLCKVNECRTPLSKRSIEREVMFVVGVKSSTVKGKPGFEIFLQPVVVKRYRREGGSWSLDQEGASLTKGLSERILGKVVSRFKGA